jgi:hypothetical protein
VPLCRENPVLEWILAVLPAGATGFMLPLGPGERFSAGPSKYCSEDKDSTHAIARKSFRDIANEEAIPPEIVNFLLRS